MGLRAKLVELLSRGEPPVRDPNELVELQTVDVHNGPMTVETLRSGGIDAIPLPSFDAALGRSETVIMVPRHQLGEAVALLDSLG
jgi:hypothetical protein